MRVWNIWGFRLTIWWWSKPDKRQKHPTAGCGFIVEKL